MAIGFGIVGCGMIASFHARAIADIRGARLVACWNRTGKRAADFGRQFDCTVCESVDQLVSLPAVDVVIICTASGAHLEPALLAARAGKHVVIEKPLEITLNRCDRIIAACAKAGVVLSTIFPSRFHRASQLLKQAVDQERFGILTLGDAMVKWYRSQEYYDSGAWRGTWELDGGGALMNQAIHSVDLLTWIMGPVAEISAQTATLAHQRIDVEDCAVASLRFENGALGVIEASTAAFPGTLKRIEVHGSQGSAVIEEEDLKVWQFEEMTARDKRIAREMQNRTQSGGGASDPAAIGHAGHTRQLKDVVRAIRKNEDPLIDGHQGRRSVEIILAIYQAARSGRNVQLPLKRDPPFLRKMGTGGG